MGGLHAASSITFVKEGPKELTLEVSLAGPDGKPVDLGGGSCKK